MTSLFEQYEQGDPAFAKAVAETIRLNFGDWDERRRNRDHEASFELYRLGQWLELRDRFAVAQGEHFNTNDTPTTLSALAQIFEPKNLAMVRREDWQNNGFPEPKGGWRALPQLDVAHCLKLLPQWWSATATIEWIRTRDPSAAAWVEVAIACYGDDARGSGILDLQMWDVAKRRKSAEILRAALANGDLVARGKDKHGYVRDTDALGWTNPDTVHVFWNEADQPEFTNIELCRADVLRLWQPEFCSVAPDPASPWRNSTPVADIKGADLISFSAVVDAHCAQPDTGLCESPPLVLARQCQEGQFRLFEWHDGQAIEHTRYRFDFDAGGEALAAPLLLKAELKRAGWQSAPPAKATKRRGAPPKYDWEKHLVRYVDERFPTGVIPKNSGSSKSAIAERVIASFKKAKLDAPSKPMAEKKVDERLAMLRAASNLGREVGNTS